MLKEHEMRLPISDSEIRKQLAKDLGDGIQENPAKLIKHPRRGVDAIPGHEESTKVVNKAL